MKSFSTVLKYGMKAGCWTDQEVSIYFGVSERTVGRWKQGKSVPQLRLRANVLFALEARALELLAAITRPDLTGLR